MIHTFNIRRTISMWSAYRLARELFSIETAEALRKGERNWKEIRLSDDFPGINKLVLLRQGFDFVSIHLEIEPQVLLAGQRTIQLFACFPDALERLQVLFLQALREISSSISWQPLKDWYMYRIDYAVNLSTEYPDELTELAKKGWKPHYYHDNVHKKGSLYWQSKSVRFNFYCKADHVRKKLRHLPEYQRLLEEAQNIFRVEVQCREVSKIKGLIRKYQLSNQRVLGFLQPHIALDVIQNYYQQVIGSGDYYNFYHALNKVNEQERNVLSTGMKEKISVFLRVIAHTKSMDSAYQCLVVGEGCQLKNGDFVSKISSSTFSNYEKICREIGINPVTIPKHKGITYMPNPNPMLVDPLSLYGGNQVVCGAK
ncbi:hypothetical protein SPSIL_052650 [Sporomusa silvacetica DSM 10669]|uniref:Replication-associated protein G2P N-terminal domain-containing protein n=1 Tax=Sporomusa silvacetica DSM 10669 TaxID=1123289 RepID=A0ABZ3ITM7_9FIRM|nr:phage/plasmid replication protein [Sporomusa silvacetica]OZC19644.1 hypothetical protein SPSIL_20740 [Sporomusa silvacetica DSM 10669]